MLTLTCIVVLGAIASLFVLIATSLDPLQIINAGAEPWLATAEWTAAFVIELLVAAIGLRLWHSRRLRAVAFVLLAAQVLFAVWAVARIYQDYT